MNTKSNRKAPSVKIKEIIIQSDYMKNLCIRVYVSLISDKYERERWLYMRTAVQILLWGESHRKDAFLLTLQSSRWQ